VIAAAAVALGVIVTSGAARTTGAARDPFVLVLSPGHATEDSARRLAAALSKETGLAVEARRAPDADDALATAGTASVDAGLRPIFEYLLLRQEFGVEARLQVLREGGRDYSGAVLVRADGGISRLADLTGQRVAYVDRASTTGFLLPARHLAAAGVDVVPVFAGTHEAALEALRDGRVSAAATYDRPPPPGLRRLAATGEVPNEPVFFHPRVPPATRDRVVAALLALSTSDAGRALLAETGGLTGFTPVTDAEYGSVRDLLAATQRGLADVVPGAWRLLDRGRAWPGNLGPH
jgi:phosphonate transport system substrate-binding protein